MHQTRHAVPATCHDRGESADARPQTMHDVGLTLRANGSNRSGKLARQPMRAALFGCDVDHRCPEQRIDAGDWFLAECNNRDAVLLCKAFDQRKQRRDDLVDPAAVDTSRDHQYNVHGCSLTCRVRPGP